MQKKLTKIGRLAPLLSTIIDPTIVLSLMKAGSFSKREIPLVEVMIKILEEGKEINAEQVFLHSKSIPILGYYMDYVNQIDSQMLK